MIFADVLRVNLLGVRSQCQVFENCKSQIPLFVSGFWFSGSWFSQCQVLENSQSPIPLFVRL